MTDPLTVNSVSAGRLKGLLKDVCLYGVGDTIGRLAALLTTPIISRIFLPEDYGTIDLLLMYYSFSVSLAGMNFETGFQKFYYQSESHDRRELCSSGLVYMFFLTLFVSACGIAGVLCLSDAWHIEKSIRNCIIILCCTLPIERTWFLLLILMRVKRLSIVFSLCNFIDTIINVSMVYILVARFRIGITGCFYARLISFCLLTTAILAYQRAEFSALPRVRKFTATIKYALPGHPALLGLSIMGFLPRTMLLSFSTLRDVGLFGIADRICRFLDMSVIGFNRAWNPFAFSIFGKEGERIVYEKVLKTLIVFLISLAFFFVAFSNEILHILTPPIYHSAQDIVPWLIIYSISKGIKLVLSTALYSINKQQFTSYFKISEIAVFLLSSLYFIPRYGSIGLAISLDIGAAMELCLYTIYIRIYFRFRVPAFKLIQILAVSIFSLVICISYIPTNIALYTVFLKLIVCACVFSLNCFLVMNSVEKQYIYSFVQRLWERTMLQAR